MARFWGWLSLPRGLPLLCHALLATGAAHLGLGSSWPLIAGGGPARAVVTAVSLKLNCASVQRMMLTAVSLLNDN